MSLGVFREDFIDFRIQFHAIFGTGFGHHLDAAVRLDGATKQFIGLQADDELVFAVNVARSVGSDGGDGGGINGTDAVVGAFLQDSFETDVPDAFGPFGRTT